MQTGQGCVADTVSLFNVLGRTGCDLCPLTLQYWNIILAIYHKNYFVLILFLLTHFVTSSEWDMTFNLVPVILNLKIYFLPYLCNTMWLSYCVLSKCLTFTMLLISCPFLYLKLDIVSLQQTKSLVNCHSFIIFQSILHLPSDCGLQESRYWIWLWPLFSWYCSLINLKLHHKWC